VVLGIQANDFGAIVLATPASKLPLYAVSGFAPSVAAGRLSYVLGLQGACHSIDTACSTALVAVHSALTKVRNAECENALTLAINIMLLPMGATLIANAGMTSRDGRCKFLDARANGYARAEGVGGVLISPERELLADMQGTAGLRGSAVRSDGKSASLTAPNGEAQVALLRAAVLDGQFDVWSISTVECHGTGTALGDPIETSAQRGALSTDDGMNEVLSGIKANVGHMEPAAAMVGLLRLSTALQNTAIAPNGQLHSLNEHVHHALRGVSCVLPAQCVVLGRAIKRMGGLSSFGYAGTIAHAVLRHDVGLGGISALVTQWDLPASERTDKGPCIPLFVRRSLAWGPITRVPASYPHSTALLASRRITRVRCNPSPAGSQPLSRGSFSHASIRSGCCRLRYYWSHISIPLLERRGRCDHD